MILDFLFEIWRRLNASLQWRLLWLINSKFMVSVAGIVYNHEGQILLQRHRHWVDDVWGLPGGIVENGESLEHAFSREVLEETGLEISDIELVKIVSGFSLRIEAYFRGILLETEPEQIIKIQQKEIVEAKFFALDKLPTNILQMHRDLIFHESMKTISNRT